MKYLYILLILCFQGKAWSATIYVDATATGTNDGTSWANAYTSLADALSEANSHTETDSILIAAGTYYPATASDPGNRDATFGIFRGGIKIYGGYPNGGGTRDVTTNEVFLDGGIGTAATTDNSHHVMVISNIAATADSIVVDGLSVRNGSADLYSFSSVNGSQMRRCYGGGISIRSVANGGKTCIRQCSIENNLAAASLDPTQVSPSPVGSNGTWILGRGAGIYLSLSSVTISNCTLANNYALGSSGGGIYADICSPLVEHCTFKGNKARGAGLAAASSTNATPLFSHCIFTNNALDPDPSEPNLMPMVISGGSPKLTNCLIFKNPGLALDLSSGEIINCTIARNQFGILGGSVHITNSIFYGNTTANLDDYNNTMQIDHSLIGGGHAGTGNINSSPYFVNLSSYDFRLQSNSPAINAGDNASTAGIENDLDGNPRITGARVDMGAFEYPTDVAGINEAPFEAGILAYPNPVSGLLHIESPVPVHAVVVSTDGKLLITQENVQAIATDALPAGIYLVKLYGAENQLLASKRFVKVN